MATHAQSSSHASAHAREPRPLQHVLAGTDFSQTAGIALDWAIHIAMSHGARLTIVHADEGSPADRLSELLRSAQANGLKVEAIRSGGKPWNVIVDAAARLNGDLVVVGSQGRSSLASAMLGSTADRVVRSSPTPVLVVHPTDRKPGDGIRTVLVPHDFSEEATHAAQAALNLLDPGSGKSTKIFLLHICELVLPSFGAVPPMPFDFPGTEPTVIDEAFWARCEQQAAGKLETIASTIRRSQISVEVQATRGMPESVIIETEESLNADLIAIGTSGRGAMHRLLLGSVVERVLKTAKCPVLTARNPQGEPPRH